MPKEPVVSFYLPAYRKPPEVFEKCLESLFDQSLKEIEVIVVFDGPNAELEAVAKRYPKAKSFVIEHGGAPKARNFGLSKATGQYVAAWDIDCFAKPDMAKRWVEEFEATDADFVYSGYELTNEQGGFASEPFDELRLECGNLVASMFPIKREKAPAWDETLKAGQDWDYWLSATKNGCKGAFIEGSGFVTLPPDKESISTGGLSGPHRTELIDRIRAKHGIPDRSIGVFTMRYRDRGLKIAKILGADYVNQQGYEPKHYKTLFMLGYSVLSRFEGISSDVVKIQYWLPEEVEALVGSKYTTVLETIRIAKNVINLCGTPYEANKLSEIGIEAEVVNLPLARQDMVEAQDKLPEKFSVLLICDENYGKLFKEIEQDMPHIKFGYQFGQVADYSCLLSFYSFAALDDPILKAHVNGRNVISNVQAPFCGFLDPSQSWESFKGELYQRLREVRGKPFNREAKDYYTQLASPETFRTKISSLSRPVLEVVA